LDDLVDNPTAESGAIISALTPLRGSALNEAVRQLSGSGLGGAGQTVQQGSRSALGTMTGGRSGGGAGTGGGQTADAGLVQFAMANTGSTGLLADFGMAAFSGMETADAGSLGRAPGNTEVWVAGIGGFGSRDADGAAVGQSRRYGGAVAGLDYAVTLELGLAFSAFAGTTESDDDLVETDTDSLVLAGHVAWSSGPWQIDGALGVAYHRFDSARRLPALALTATGDRDGYEVTGDIAARYELAVDGFTLAPVAGLAVSWLHQQAWQETGAAGANLAVASSNSVSVQPRLGIGVSTEIDLGGGLVLAPQAEALYVAEVGDRDSGLTAHFPGAAVEFTVPAVEEPRHSGAVAVSIDLMPSDGGWALSAGYAGRFSRTSQDHGFLAGARLRL
ncbi:MAG: autotransporter outer membrane beta-barrel domain-containing protein, partial [Rhodospirillaceae bacterium]|nr:autotransporter outer membrane beta-barrel domain-containing protein [Rhodospirillaceae bacterium]